MKISEAEKRIMDLLWHQSPMTARQLINELDDDIEWHEKTVKTLINRLLKKKAIRFEKQGREYLYFPLLAEQVYKQELSRSFIQRMFKGDVSSFLAAFVRSGSMSESEIAELRQIVEKLDEHKDKE